MRKIATCAVLIAATIGSAKADSLEDALSHAYSNNPSLQAKRAKLKATDEQVPQALSGWRPTIKLVGEAGRTRVESNLLSPQEQVRDPKSGTLSVSQPLYNGGKTAASTDKAENTVLAERAALLSSEQSLLLGAATAYMDNVRDEAVLKLNISNEQVLRRQLEATNDRFRVGEITRTDVAQAEARLSKAIADRIQAEGNLKSSRAAYVNQIGKDPNDISFPNPPGGLPGEEKNAVDIALGSNPDILAATYAEKAAQSGIKVAEADFLPSLSLDGSLGRDWRSTSHLSKSETATGKLSLTVPIYSAGTVDSKVRESKYTAQQKRLESDQVRRSVTETTAKAWEALQTARARITSYSAQIKASEVALEGVTREASVGSRTVLDVLNAEQELLDARVNLVKAQRDEMVAIFQLKSALGDLTAQSLKLGVDVFDPTSNYNDVRGQWRGTSIQEE